jgi:hypothetical protein
MTKYIMNSLSAITEIDETPRTAYELAQYLEIAFYSDSDIENAANMLRMQADEIKALREQLNELL